MHINKDLPIGVFDSGVGGLTVLKAMLERMPHERFIYLGDSARLPYGTKSPATIQKYALQASSKLVERGVKMLVVACNTASSVALPTLKDAFKFIPVIGVINPGAEAAIKASKSGHIVVIATEATISGNAYQNALKCINPSIQVSAKSCPLFVPLAEEGWVSGEIVEKIASKYIYNIFHRQKNVIVPDTLLLGCTHFPIFKHALQQVVGANVNLVDSALTTAAAVENNLVANNALRDYDYNNLTAYRKNMSKVCIEPNIPQNELKNALTISDKYSFLATDDIARFKRVGSLFLGQDITESYVELVDL